MFLHFLVLSKHLQSFYIFPVQHILGDTSWKWSNNEKNIVLKFILYNQNLWPMFILITMLYKDHDHNLAKNLDGLDIRLLHLYLRNRHSENTILHCSLNLIHLSILRKPKPPQELAAAMLHSMPCLFLLFLLHFPLCAYLEHSVIFNFDLYFLFLKPKKISFEHMDF